MLTSPPTAARPTIRRLLDHLYQHPVIRRIPSALAAGPIQLFVRSVFEPLVDNRGVWRQGNAVQIDDVSVYH
jgi:hypothetical protein